jgi:NADPH-dependent glutamate synthase beta subunit-like oxidoreductase
MVDVMRSGDTVGDLSCGAHTVIYGAGELALQSVRRCRELGATSITVVMRRTRDQSPIPADDQSALEGEGAALVYGSCISRLLGEGSSLTDVEIEDLATGQTKTLAAQTLVFASGRFPELVFVQQKSAEEVDDAEQAPDAGAAEEAAAPVSPESVCWEAVPPYKKPLAAAQTGLFAEGDALTDYSAAIKAIGAGRRAAASLHKIMYGIALDLPENTVTPTSILQDVDHVEKVERSARQIMPLGHGGEAGPLVELEKGFGEEAALTEAKRCLQCGLICYERPDMNPEMKVEVA